MIATARTGAAAAFGVGALLVLVGVAVPSAAATPEACDFPYSATDATDTDVTVGDEPDRIVSLGPSASQTLWEIGAEDDVVGLTGNGYYLDGASDLPNVYDAGSFSYQTDEIVNLSPDLVLAPNIVFQPTIDQLRAANLTVYRFPAATDTDDVEEKTTRIGRLTGHCFGARQTNGWMTESIAAVDDRVAGSERPRVFYHIIGDFTAGRGSFVHDAVTTAGGKNVAAEAGITFYAPYGDDVLVQHDPEWILTAESTPVPDRPAFTGTTAVESGQTLDIRDRYVSQPAPRVVYAVRRMARAFHPDAFERPGRGTETNVTRQNQSAVLGPASPNRTSGNVTVRFDGAVPADLAVEALPSPGPDAPGTALGTWRLTTAAADRNRSATLTFSMPRKRLDAVGAGADDLAAFRRHEGGWTRLRRIETNETEDAVDLTVRTPGFSVFTVAAVSPPRASLPRPEDTVEAGRSITFRADRSDPIHGRIAGYEWRTGNASGTGPSFTTAFEEPGRHEVSLTVRTAANLTDTTTATVNVTAPTSTDGDVGGERASTDDGRGQSGFVAVTTAIVAVIVAAARHRRRQ